jgi:TetR/AcrR family transcriptional regulator, regulator of cefoperazone and chloramphenicol sensitivity
MPDHENTRNRILESAGELFAERGFDATNVRDITSSAGTNLAAVNYHFGNKERLYVEAVRHAARSCDASAPMPRWTDEEPEQRLRDFIRAFLERVLRSDKPAWHRLLIFREVAQPRPGACEEFVREFVRPTFDVLLGILRKMVPASVQARELHLLGGSIVGQCLHYHHDRHIITLLVGEDEFNGYDLERLTDHLWRFSVAALRGLYPTLAKGGRA